MINYFDIYNIWMQDPFFDKKTRDELSALNMVSDKKEIEDRFYRELEFGTGGLRGIMGAGTNRMNQYTVGKAAKGLGRYLLDTYGCSICGTRGAVIGYDTRGNSSFFAKITADILSGMGIRTYLYTQARPTPQLSYTVRELNTVAGVVITASHNPKEYNGLKVYDESGCQMAPCRTRQVMQFISRITDYRMIDFTGNPQLIGRVDLTEKFVEAVIKQSRYGGRKAKADLHIVYTPLHGTGRFPISETLSRGGFSHVEIVKEQAEPDGEFPTVQLPNPEDGGALELGLAKAEKINADIVIGTDPDCDRIGVAVKTEAGYRLLSGNQVGALLTDFLIYNTDLSVYRKPAIIKTVVTSELGAFIARKNGISVFTTLTGFKYIGERITQFEQAKQNHDVARDYDFLFGYEESYGYLAGEHARDKDAVVSALLVCEMAAKLKTAGKTLADRLDEIYGEFGYYRDALESFTLTGKYGREKIASIMAGLRLGGSPFPNTEQITDYMDPVDAEPGFHSLPSSDVLKYLMDEGSWIAIRPSGTEPKLKLYYSIKGRDEKEANGRFSRYQMLLKDRLRLESEDS